MSLIDLGFGLFFISLGAVLVIGGIALVVTVITGPSKVAEYQPEPTDGAPVLGFTQYHGSHGGPY